MKSLSKYNKGIKSLLCSIDIFSKYEWVVPLKDRWRVIIVNVSQKKYQKGAKQSPKDANQMKYGLIKGVNFTIIFTKDFWE